MEKAVLKASPRAVTGKQVRALRRAGQLPGVIYGYGIKPTPISMDAHNASLVLSRLTTSSLITIQLEGKEYPTLVRERQRNFIKGNLVHVDFQVVSLTETIRARVGIELTGASPVTKDFNAVLVTSLNELEVECLPQDLPARIIVDISGLINIGDGIHVRDIVLSEKVKILSDTDEMIVVATAAKEEEIVEEVVPVEEIVEPELIEKGKKEEEIPEEGEATGEQPKKAQE